MSTIGVFARRLQQFQRIWYSNCAIVCTLRPLELNAEFATAAVKQSNLANEHNHTIENYEFQFDRLVFTLFCCALHFYEQIFFDFRFMLT